MPEFNEKAMQQFNQGLIKEFRENGGKAVSGPFVNAPLLFTDDYRCERAANPLPRRWCTRRTAVES